jgi:CelD/BcsL family acetyltransferase involved in cellulose biosynthesis
MSPGGPEIRIHLATSFDDLLDLGSEWLALETRVGAELPFQTWEWAVAWWQHLRGDSRGVRDQLRVCVVRDEHNAVVAIAPLVLTERPSFGPARLRHLQFIGADPNITEIRTILCRPELEEDCYRALRAHFANRADDWDWINWDGTPALATEGSDQRGLIAGGDRSTYVLKLTADWPSMKAQLGRNIKESLRKCYNSLRRDGLTCALEIVEDPARIDGALEDFFRLHAERASQNNTVRHADVFASEQARAFLVQVCRGLAERGVARVFRLRVNNRVVATRVGFQMGRSLYLYYSGWDAAFGRYSVMTTLVAEVLKHAISRGLTTVNLSTGNDVSKTRWRPQEVRYRSRIEVAPGFAAHARYATFQAARSIGAGQLARNVLLGGLARRSEPSMTWQRPSHQQIMSLGLAAAAAGAVALGRALR